MTHPQTTNSAANKRRGQIQALLLMLVVAVPMLAAYIIYHTGWGMPSATANQGALLAPPIAITDFALTEQEQPWQISQERKHWRYVLPGNGQCNQICQDNLYLTRQVHIRLNEKADRVERIYLLLDDALSPSTAEFMQQQHPLLRVMSVDRSEFEHALKGSNINQDTVAAGQYFLMDQEGFLMLSYTPEHRGGELLKDVKKMLKTSYE